MQYQVQDPNGNIHIIEGPDGATPEQIMAQAQQIIPSSAQETTEQFAARTEGPGIQDATVSDFLAPYLTGEASKALGLTKALGTIFQKVGGAAPEFLGKVLSWITPNQSSALLSFVRENPEWYDMIQSQVKNASSLVAKGLSEGGTASEAATGAMEDLTEAAKPALQIFKNSPQAFADHLQQIIDSKPGATSLTDFSVQDRGFLWAAYQQLMKGGSKSMLTRFLGAGLLGKLGLLFGGPVGGALTGALEYGLESPTGGVLAQQLAGKLANIVGGAASTVGSKLPYAAPLVAQGLQNANPNNQ